MNPLTCKEDSGLASILAHLGCYNKILQPGWLINNRNFCFIVLEAGKSKTKALTGSVCGGGLLSDSQIAFLLPPPQGGKELELQDLLSTAPIPIVRALHPDLITSQRLYLPIPSQWSQDFNIMHLGKVGRQYGHIQTVIDYLHFFLLHSRRVLP